MNEKEINAKLEKLLLDFDDGKRLLRHVFNYCETTEERKKMIDFIETKKPTYGKVCEYSAVLAIEAGTAEGELEECDDDYWDKED